jgi:hypothetical protein
MVVELSGRGGPLCPPADSLYASPGKEKFYETLHFRKMKTGMAIFTRADTMAERGFFGPFLAF